MEIIDISVCVPDAPVYPGDPKTELRRVLKISGGSDCNLTEVSMSVHAGTHADAPLHFIDSGMPVDSLNPSLFCGRARVVTVYKKSGDIEADDIRKLDIKKGERILFKTRNSIDGHVKGSEFYLDFCAVAPSAARYLADKGIILAGIDYASIGHGDGMTETHTVLLKSGAAVIEWLDLSYAGDGFYFLSAAPVKLRAEGAPCRALLFRQK